MNITHWCHQTSQWKTWTIYIVWWFSQHYKSPFCLGILQPHSLRSEKLNSSWSHLQGMENHGKSWKIMENQWASSPAKQFQNIFETKLSLSQLLQDGIRILFGGAMVHHLHFARLNFSGLPKSLMERIQLICAIGVLRHLLILLGTAMLSWSMSTNVRSGWFIYEC